MQKNITLGLAILFAVIGIAAFVPALAPTNSDGQILLGIFQVNTAQNYIHLLTAIAAGAAVLAGGYYMGTYLKIFGIVYAIVALWGIPAFTGTYDGVLFSLIHVNLATELLHIVIAAAALYGGFMSTKEAVSPMLDKSMPAKM